MCNILHIYRRSRSQVFFIIGSLKNFAIFKGKHLYWSLKAVNFIKKRFQHRYFPVNIEKFLKTGLFVEYLWWLLLYIVLKADQICNVSKYLLRVPFYICSLRVFNVFLIVFVLSVFVFVLKKALYTSL